MTNAMNDTQNTTPVTQEAITTAAPVPAPPSKPTAAADPATKAKKKSKSRRTRTRRRAVASDQESGDEGGAGNQSESSLSSRSDAPNSESEDESAPKPAPTGPKAKGSKSSKTPVFADVSSITPPGWSGKNGDDVTPISFEDFNAGKEAPATPAPARGTGLSIRGRGKGKVESATRREYTPEETAKYEAQKAKRKEKVKAKRAALKEEKQKENTATKAAPTGEFKSSDPAAPALSDTKVPTSAPETTSSPATKPGKAKGKKRKESVSARDSAPTPTVEDITASTSAVTLDTSAAAEETTESAPSAADAPTSAVATDGQDESHSSSAQQRQPPRQPRGNAREAQAQRAAQDPKFTPRAGQFWTHDQRLHDGGNPGDVYNNGPRQMGPFFRGRAIPRGGFRGNMRGRGRGGFFPNIRGGFANGGPPRNVELSQEEDKKEGGSKLAMDREYELAEARDKARAAPPAPPQVEMQAEEGAGDGTSDSAPPPPPAPSLDRKWGHEGYEAMSAPVAGQIRGAYRGRVRGAGPGVRGRGAFFPRGGHLPFAPPHRQMRPAQLAAAARAQVQAPSPAPPAAAATIPSSAIESQPATVAKDREQMSTQPTADSLLDPADESFKIKFPGSAASTVPAAPSPVVSSAPVPPAAPSTKTEIVTPATADVPSVQAPSVSAPSPALQASEPQFPSLHTGSPAPVAAVQAQMYTGGSNHSMYQLGSENGSVGSGHFVQHPSQFYPPEFVPNGMAMQQRPGFYPQHSHRGYPAQSPGFYPPQSPYSPDPYEHQQQPHHHAHHPHSQQRGSFSGAPMTSPQGVFFPQGQVNGYVNGRSSPLNPYMNMNQPGSGGGGFFAPVRGTNKVAIRAPNQNQNQNGDGNGNESSEIGAVANGSTSATNGTSSLPTSGDAYQAQHYNPYVQPFVPGQRRQDETTYYPLTNGQQYGWQGYNGEQGYYDGGVNYGY